MEAATTARASRKDVTQLYRVLDLMDRMEQPRRIFFCFRVLWEAIKSGSLPLIHFSYLLFVYALDR